MKIAVLVSGNGTNLQSILAHIASGALHAELVLVAANKTVAPALEHARAADVAVWAQNARDFASREDFDRALMVAIDESGAELVVLAGYMRLLSAEFVQHYDGRLMNIHPALLPSFAGLYGVPDACEYGVTIAGVTVHFVSEIMDSGAIIIQAAMPIASGDAVADVEARIHALEHRMYPQAIEWFAEKRLRLEGRKVQLLPPQNGQKRKEAALEHNVLFSPPLEMGF